MKIEKHISELLKFNNFVVIPDFGSFISTYVSSTETVEQNQFNPPSNEIVFNSRIIKNDGLLASHISEKENISYRDAENSIFRFVDHTLDQLSRGSKIEMDYLGTITMSRQGNLIFDQNKEKDVFPFSFGLESFSMEPLAHIQRKELRIEHPAVRKVIKNRPLVRVAASVSLLLALSLLPYSHKQNYALSDAIPVQQLINEKPSNAIASITEEIVEAKKEVDKNFMLIAGSFKSLKNAEVLINELKQSGFTPNTIELDNGYIRVSIDEFANIEEAKSARDKYQIENPDLRLWISKNS